MATRGRKHSRLWRRRAHGMEVYDRGIEEYRVQIPECRLSVEDALWLESLAEERGVSRSRALEEAIRTVFVYGLLGKPLGAKMVRANLRRGVHASGAHTVKSPKLTIHHEYIEMMRRDKERRRVSWSVELQLVLRAYRDRYLRKLENPKHPPFISLLNLLHSDHGDNPNIDLRRP